MIPSASRLRGATTIDGIAGSKVECDRCPCDDGRTETDSGHYGKAKEIEDRTMPQNYRSHCNACPYNQGGTRPLSMERSPNSDVLLVLQAPGKDEWKAKKPICSPSPHSAAARIRNTLNRISKNRSDFSITNAVQCYPGVGSNGRDKRPRKGAILQCSNWLKRDINSKPWRRIIVFGKPAKKVVRDLGFSSDPRFKFYRHPSGNLTNESLKDALNH